MKTPRLFVWFRLQSVRQQKSCRRDIWLYAPDATLIAKTQSRLPPLGKRSRLHVGRVIQRYLLVFKSAPWLELGVSHQTGCKLTSRKS